MKQLRVFRSMGKTFSVGWMRDDARIVHVFAKAAPGELFQPSDGHGNSHWPCDVCTQHGFTEADFHDQILDALERGPEG